MDSKAPKHQATQPQQWTTANGTPSPIDPNEVPPAASQRVAKRPLSPTEELDRALDAAATALEPTGVALPNPVVHARQGAADAAFEPTLPALPNLAAGDAERRPSISHTVPSNSVAPNIPEQIAMGVAKTQAASNRYRTADPAAPLSPGDPIGDRYVIESHISSGSFGAVYKASDRAIPNHTLAIKLLHMPAESDEAREKGLRELRLIASVAHPSVVQFKDYGWHEGRLWFAMPWYSGQTLYDRIGGDDEALRTGLSRAEARPIFERLALGLAAMHAVGIHHHDIKPENVFLANVAGFEGGFPVLLDLGIAAAEGELPAGFTAEYAAPETANTALGVAGHAIGAPADVFSLALTLRNVLDPDMIADPEVPSIALLTTRAAQSTPGPARRDLRYLKPHFARWLNLDPDERPSPEEFAAELAVLTEPEERRAQRMRVLRRAAPFVLLAAGAMAFLGYRLSQEQAVVSQQQQVITVQGEKLSEQLAEADALRQASQQQLAALEATKNEVGDKEAQLKRALKIAHDLDRQLSRLEQVRLSLSDRIAKLNVDLRNTETSLASTTQHRDRLQSERDGLVAERDGLVQQRSALRAERDALSAERSSLRGERDNLVVQVQDLERVRASLSEERENLRRSIDTFIRERDSAQAARDAALRERDQSNAELARLRATLDDLEVERNRLRAENASLRRGAESGATVSGGTSTGPASGGDNVPAQPPVIDPAVQQERPVRKPRRRTIDIAPTP